ncbi:terminase large subunit domain-containing protein [Rhodopila sp.]|uniref:terminase large subunit domain-containing protein n=1 Tax=Rhodopila sp. TaxID=2480087 RepID=UPI003D13E80D
MRHALDPVAWAADVLNWHADTWQADLLRSPAKQIAVANSRQSGKSTSTSILAAHTALFQPGALVLLTSPSQRQASELLKKVHGVLTTPGIGIRLVADAATSLELPNGARIVSLPASPESVRGYSQPALIVEDEAAYCPDELHLALRPMLAASPRGRMVLLSTPAGRAGHFYEAMHSPNWQRFKVTAYDCPRISREFLEQELREHGDLYFAREYLCEFSDSEFSFFGSDLIAAAFNCDAAPLRVRLFT